MIEQFSVPTAAGSFDVIAAGPQDGRGVLLLHGFPEAATEWAYPVAVLGGSGYRAVAPDQRGYSPQVRPERVSDYRIEELTADVLAVADQLGWSRFDLVGHDWGAIVGWITAAEHPDRVRTLTAVSVPHPGAFAKALREDPEQQQRSAYLETLRQTRTAERALLDNDAENLRRIYDWKVPPSHIDDYVRRLSEPGALTAALNWYRANRHLGRVDRVEVPTMYVWSTEDTAIGSTAALDTEHWVSGPYRFEMLEDVSHWVPEEAPEEFTALLLDHLSSHKGTR
ncbi:alpha/beta fold hydrolase [Amycolatopsis nigrescens]|uniref:alpha/beta fold hydrolase n=1 Tax=Amycolatopsis nigrescens TaxID=381445 RepID=UPI0003702887|nr:alpha/beta hydrolase [Amycolatopsis nigrescens]